MRSWKSNSRDGGRGSDRGEHDRIAGGRKAGAVRPEPEGRSRKAGAERPEPEGRSRNAGAGRPETESRRLQLKKHPRHVSALGVFLCVRFADQEKGVHGIKTWTEDTRSIAEKNAKINKKGRFRTMISSTNYAKTTESKEKRRKQLFRLEVENALKRLGISPETAGFALLTMAVQLWIDETDRNGNGMPPQVTKVIYPTLSKIVGKSPLSVERNMRYAIERAMSCDSRLKYATRAFDMAPDPGRKCYTTGQFIALVALMLRSYGGGPPAA